MRDLMDALNGRYADELGEINTRAVAVRELTRTLLAQVRADLAETLAAGEDDGALGELVRQLETSLGDPGVAFDELTARERALEQRMAAVEELVDQLRVAIWPTVEELLERDP